jgi:nickel transport protein
MNGFIHKTTRTAILGVFLLCMFTAPVCAHKVTVIGWVEGDTVFLEGYFSTGTKAENAEIQVSGPGGEVLVEGRTDENGEFSFKVPAVVTLKVLLNAGMGHQATCEIAEEDIRAEAALAGDGTDEGDVKGAATTIDETALRAIVSSEISKQLNRFSRQLNTSGSHGDGPSITDILGGIGYIIGLVGLGTFYNYRRKIKNRE